MKTYMNTNSYLIPAKITCYQQEIKRSKFLAWIAPVNSPQVAKQWIQSLRDKYPDARHVCWAYIAGAPNTSLKSMSDDGEPNGTAGKPILNVIEHSGVGDIGVVVVRYFGGIKLGAGGLARAYSSSVSEAMKQAEFIHKVAMQELELKLPYAKEAQVRYLLADAQGKVLDIKYNQLVTLLCHLPAQGVNHFKKRLEADVIVTKN
jgi:uncharacterized YigZ family protein